MNVDATFLGAVALFHAAIVVRALVDLPSRRVPRPTAAWFALTFGSLVPANTLLWLTMATDVHVSDLTYALAIVPVFVFPRALLGFTTSLRPVDPRWAHLATATTIGLVTLLLLLLPQVTMDGTRTAALQALIVVESVQWLVISITSIVLLVRSSDAEPALVRTRLRAIAWGIVLLGIANVVRSTESGEAHVAVWSSITLVGTAFAYVGYSPPAAVRSTWTRADRSALRRAIAAVLEVERPEDVGRALLPSASRLVGGTGAALVDRHGAVLTTSGISTQRARAVRAKAIDIPDGDYLVIDSVACFPVGYDLLLVAISPATPTFGREEFELLLTVVSTANLAIHRLRTLDRLRGREAQLVEAHRVSRIAAWRWSADEQQLMGGDDLDTMLGDDRTMVQDAIAEAVETAADPTARIEFDLALASPNSDGPRSLHVRSATPGNGSGGRGGASISGTVQDISDRVAAERALMEAVERERAAAEELRRLGRLKDDILIAVSHELRTPLTTILGLASTLRDRGEAIGPDQRAELLDHVVEGAERLERLLVDLLDLNRLRRGLVDVDRRPVDAAQLVRGVVESLDAASIAIELDLEPGTAEVDPVKVERIVENLVGNARKYAADSPEPIVVELRLEPTVRITVHDRGPGVPCDEREAIFEPFTRASGAGAVPGTGVGLSLVAEFARVHGGSAWVEERPGGGASFCADLGPRHAAT